MLLSGIIAALRYSLRFQIIFNVLLSDLPAFSGAKKRLDDIKSGPMDSQLIDSFPCQGANS